MNLVGKPATVQVGSDSYAATVISASPSGKTVTARKNLSGTEYTFTLRHNGKLVLRKLPANANMRLAMGVNVDHLDPSF